jgi:hypothetical protein
LLLFEAKAFLNKIEGICSRPKDRHYIVVVWWNLVPSLVKYDWTRAWNPLVCCQTSDVSKTSDVFKFARGLASRAPLWTQQTLKLAYL